MADCLAHLTDQLYTRNRTFHFTQKALEAAQVQTHEFSLIDEKKHYEIERRKSEQSINTVGLAVVAPEWLRAHSHPEWVERYGPRSEDSRSPLGEQAREAFVEEIGAHGRELLDALFNPMTPWYLA